MELNERTRRAEKGVSRSRHTSQRCGNTPGVLFCGAAENGHDIRAAEDRRRLPVTIWETLRIVLLPGGQANRVTTGVATNTRIRKNRGASVARARVL